MSSKKRRYFTSEKKAQIVRRHLADKVAVSDLADEFGIQPSVKLGRAPQLVQLDVPVDVGEPIRGIAPGSDGQPSIAHQPAGQLRLADQVAGAFDASVAGLLRLFGHLAERDIAPERSGDSDAHGADAS